MTTAERMDASTRPLTIGLVLAVTMAAFEALAVTTAMPKVIDDLGGIRLYGAAFSVYMLANMVSLVVLGQMADRHGPARPFAIGLGCFTVGLAIATVAPSMPVLVLGRAVQGFGGGAVASTAYVAIGRGYPPERRATMFAILSAAWVVPGLLAPAAAGLIAEHLSWRLVFGGLLPLPPLLALLALPSLRRLPPERGVEPEPSRLRDALLVAVGAGLAVTGLQERHAVLGAALVVVGVPIAWPALIRLLPPGTLTGRPGLPSVIACRLLLSFAFFGADAFIPLAVTSVRGRSPVYAGVALTTASITWASASFVQSRRAARGDDRRMVRQGMLIVLAGILLTMPVLIDAIPAWITFISWAVAGWGMGFAFNTTSVAALAAAPPGREGRTSASLQLADVLGVAVGTGIGGAMVGYGDAAGWDEASALLIAWTVAAAAAVLAAIATRGVQNREPLP